jgi:predicted porin
MKINVFALAVLAALTGEVQAQSQSTVTVFGVLDAVAYHRQLAGETSMYKLDNGGMTTSFFGFRGSEDLGGGLKAIFDLTSYVQVDTGVGSRNPATDNFWSRSAWVGLDSNSYGTLRAGRQTSLGFHNLIRYSAFYNSATFGPSLQHNYQPAASVPMMTGSGGAGTGDSGWSNSVGYTSPTFGGVVGSVIIAPDEGTTAGRRQGVSLNYAGGPFAAGVVVENIDKMSLNFSKAPETILMTKSRVENMGASYDFNVVKVFGQYIRTKLNNATTEIKLTTGHVSAAVPIGAGQLLVGYAKTKKNQTAAADQERKTASFGYDYNLSKRTDLYAMVMNDKVTSKNSGTGFGMGIRHRF